MEENGPNELAVKVIGKVPKGSIILVANDQLPEENVPRLMNELRRISGHDSFLVWEVSNGSTVGIHGPDDIKAAIKSLVQEELDAIKH